MSDLLPTDKLDLADYERIIATGAATFVAVGRALHQIRDRKLYRAEFRTFEDYCQQRWGWGRQSAWYYIQAAEVAENVNPSLQTPLSVTQARALAPLPAAQQVEVAQVVDFSSVTIRELREVIKAKQEPKEPIDEYGRNPRASALYADAQAWSAEEAGYVPVKAMPHDHGYAAWFTAVVDECLTRFDPTWLATQPPTPDKAGEYELDADWWGENATLLRDMATLLERIAAAH